MSLSRAPVIIKNDLDLELGLGVIHKAIFFGAMLESFLKRLRRVLGRC